MALPAVIPPGVFPFGTHVYREPHQDSEELLADLPVLKRLGFTMIKIQESWAIDEPRPGEIDLSRIERVMARAGDLGLGIYLGLTMEQAPAWLWQQFPEAALVYADGRPHYDPTQYCLPTDGKPGPCWDHPGARAAGERFIGELARRLGRFENLWVWNVWQEIGFWHNEGGALGFCYCPHTLARFRVWLGERYGSLAGLNAAWSTAYADWDTIEPPRRDSFVPSFIDWRYFMDDVYIPQALAWKTRALKANDPARRPVFSHVASPSVGSSAEWRWAEAGDFFGNSNYPAWAPFDRWDDAASRQEQHDTLLYELWNAVMLRSDLTRAAAGRDRGFWGAEFQGGPISTGLHLGRTPQAADIRRWVLAGLASGMTGISFWNHRAERFWNECNGFGLLDAQGTTTPRAEEAGRLARALAQAPDLFTRGQVPQARVALLVNEDLYHFCQGTGGQTADLLAYNLRGHYARLWRLGIPVDFVDTEAVATGALAAYSAALLPMPLALDAAYFAHLRHFVEHGGTLIAEACPGRFDRLGFCPRPQMVEGAEALFGARHQGLRIVREPSEQRRWTPTARGWGEFAPPTDLTGVGDFAGESLRASFYLQSLSLTDGEAILQAGEDVSGVRRASGTGQAILLGTFTGICATAYTHPASDRFWQLLLAGTGVQPERYGALLRRRRVLDDQEAWFLINPTAETVTEVLDIAGYLQPRDLLGEHLIASDTRLTLTVPAAGVACVLLTGSR